MIKNNLKNRIFQNEANFILVISVFYLINHGLILLIPNALFWDDWLFYDVSSENLFNFCSQFGCFFNFNAYVFTTLNQVGLWSYKLLTLFLIFGSGLAINQILKSNNLFSNEARLILVILYLALPFFAARVSLVIIVYSICIFLFFSAWAIMNKYRILSLLLFFGSFQMASLLVFYAVPFMESFYRNQDFSLKSLLSFIVKKIDFVLLPFIYWGIKFLYFRPNGIYKNYNEEFSLESLFMSPLYMIWNWINIEISLLIFLFSLPIFTIILKKLIDVSHLKFQFSHLTLFLVGCFVFFAGGFAYWVLGLTPIFNDWNSRHQALLFLGTSLIILALIMLLSKRLKLIALSVILSLAISINVPSYLSFYLDWQKQQSLIELIKNDSLIEKSDLVIFKDLTNSLNAFNRYFRSFEWNGIMAKAFNNEKRMGLNSDDYKKLINKQLFDQYLYAPTLYKSKDFDIRQELIVTEVSIRKAADINDANLWRRLFSPPEITLISIPKGKVKLDIEYLY